MNESSPSPNEYLVVPRLGIVHLLAWLTTAAIVLKLDDALVTGAMESEWP